MGTWSVVQARAWARERLANAGIDSVDADVRELLEWACDASSQWDLPAELNEEQAEKLRSAVGERALRIPLQHVTSRMFFRGLTLAACPGVFVVRPETEVLAGLAIDEAMSVVARRGEARVVDLCAGSGAIGLSVVSEVPGSQVWAVELSPNTAEWTRRNLSETAKKYPSIASNYHLEIADATSFATLAQLDGTVDIVITNPPYVPQTDIPEQPEVRDWDPELALYGGSMDGTLIPERIIERACRLLKPGGVLVMEHDVTQGDRLVAFARATGFAAASTGQDWTGRDRYLFAVS